MKKKYTLIKSVFSIVLGSLLFCSTLLAQAPERMSYQAIVRNSSQQLVTNQSVGLQFSILQNSPSGTALYVERHTVSTIANGLVSVEIGAGAVQSGSMAAIDWSAKAVSFCPKTSFFATSRRSGPRKETTRAVAARAERQRC